MMRTDAGQRCGKRFQAPLIGREISCVNAESATYIGPMSTTSSAGRDSSTGMSKGLRNS